MKDDGRDQNGGQKKKSGEIKEERKRHTIFKPGRSRGNENES